jgi:hypothetical protein
MIDIHPPEHGIHGTRDFFLHLFTITIGLLIALGLEAGVEALHHRHQREQAETLVRQEIQNNLDGLNKAATVVNEELHQMNHVMDTLQAATQSQPGTLRESEFVFREAPMQDAAWRTASSTGALSLMDYAEVERFSDAYKEQALLQTMEEQALDDYLQLMPILSHHSKEGVVDPETAKNALAPTQRIIAHLNGMLDVGQGTIGAYEEALKQ